MKIKNKISEMSSSEKKIALALLVLVFIFLCICLKHYFDLTQNHIPV